jgi:hypothetical protein
MFECNCVSCIDVCVLKLCSQQINDTLPQALETPLERALDLYLAIVALATVWEKVKLPKKSKHPWVGQR